MDIGELKKAIADIPDDVIIRMPDGLEITAVKEGNDGSSLYFSDEEECDDEPENVEDGIMVVSEFLVIDFIKKELFIDGISEKDAYIGMKNHRGFYTEFLRYSIDGLLGEFEDMDGNRDGNGSFQFDGKLTKGWVKKTTRD